MKLRALDVLVTINPGRTRWDKLCRWAVGPYSHVFLYLGKWKAEGLQSVNYSGYYWFNELESYATYTNGTLPIALEIPYITESIGRGRLLHSIEDRYGERCKVMRVKLEYYHPAVIQSVLARAVELSGQYSGWYGYDDIFRYVIPRILDNKFGWRLPMGWAPDSHPICSEHVEEIFRSTFTQVLKIPAGWIPMPGDFVTRSFILEDAGDIVLGPEVV